MSFYEEIPLYYSPLGVLDQLEYGDRYVQFSIDTDRPQGFGYYLGEQGILGLPETTDSITRRLHLHSTYLVYYRHKDRMVTPKGNKRILKSASNS